MVTSLYHNNTNLTAEKNLIENLVMEAIKIHGVDMYYLPRQRFNEDPIYLDDPAAQFKHAYFIEMYIKTFDGFQGQGDIFNKMGLSVQDEMILTISRRRFAEEIGTAEGLVRPREGDLVFLPLNNAIFEIKFVEHEANFYQVGGLYFYELTCHKFEYNSERIDTGIADIDDILLPVNNDAVLQLLPITSEAGAHIITESGVVIYTEANLADGSSQNQELQNASDNDLIDFSEENPFGNQL